jgi:cytochrome c556
MKWYKNKTVAAAALALGMGATPLALSHLDPDAFHLSYRQSLFAILGANFGPMSSMIKGEIPWDDKRFQGFAEDLAMASELDFMRGFPDGSQSGQTRAKPAIWNNKADFEAKLNDLRDAAAELAQVAAGDDKKAIMEQFKTTGGTCKACHDDYKSKDYLNQ